MKKKLLASLVLTLALSACASEPPSSFSIPQALDTTLGADGCPIEEPCLDYEAEEIAIQDALEARAWAAFDSYNFQPVDYPLPIVQEFVEETTSSDTEGLQPGFWRLPDPNNHDVVYVFQSVVLTTV